MALAVAVADGEHSGHATATSTAFCGYRGMTAYCAALTFLISAMSDGNDDSQVATSP